MSTQRKQRKPRVKAQPVSVPQDTSVRTDWPLPPNEALRECERLQLLRAIDVAIAMINGGERYAKWYIENVLQDAQRYIAAGT